jgi:MoxR-like ATPase
MFKNDHMGEGLLPNATEVLRENTPDKLDPVDLAVFFLRDVPVPDLAPRTLVSEFQKMFNLTEEDMWAFTTFDQTGWTTRTVPQGEDWAAENLPINWKPTPAPSAAIANASRDAEIRSIEDDFTVILEDRVRRMLETSIIAYSGVIAVGPPGTGKTTLMRQIADAIKAKPDQYGFVITPESPIVATPDEGWTTRDLVGGETIIDGKLTFSPGLVLNAIAQGRWVILDEINRADMDRIFGGLMTWLSGKQVVVGRMGPEESAPIVVLGWSGKPECEVVETASHISYLAGDEWRLLGTYNAVDAAKVFRFGQALGRRFVRVPIPPASDTVIEPVLRSACQGLPDRTVSDILALYRAHLSVEPLGPALFLRLPRYISCAGITDESEHGAYAEVLAEAYVVAAGSSINRLDAVQLEQLISSVSGADPVFSADGWYWIKTMCENIG